MSKREMVSVGISQWPTELVAKAEYEITLFDRPSIDTCNDMLAEIKSLRAKLKNADHLLKRIHQLDKSCNLDRHSCGSGVSSFEYTLEQIEEYLGK